MVRMIGRFKDTFHYARGKTSKVKYLTPEKRGDWRVGHCLTPKIPAQARLSRKGGISVWDKIITSKGVTLVHIKGHLA